MRGGYWVLSLDKDWGIPDRWVSPQGDRSVTITVSEDSGEGTVEVRHGQKIKRRLKLDSQDLREFTEALARALAEENWPAAAAEIDGAAL